MKKENKNNYYNTEDEIHFEKLDKFKRYNSKIDRNKKYKDHEIKYSNSDKNNFNNIIKTDEKVGLYNEIDIDKEINYYSSSDFNKFEQLDNFSKYINNEKDKGKNSNLNNEYKTSDYTQFNAIIQMENKGDKFKKIQKNNIKVVDYGKLEKDQKKLKNKLGIEKIKIVYFD